MIASCLLNGAPNNYPRKTGKNGTGYFCKRTLQLSDCSRGQQHIRGKHGTESSLKRTSQQSYGVPEAFFAADGGALVAFRVQTKAKHILWCAHALCTYISAARGRRFGVDGVSIGLGTLGKVWLQVFTV